LVNGEEEVAAQEGGDEHRVIPAGGGEGGDGRDIWTRWVEEEAEEGRRVPFDELAAEGRRGDHRGAPLSAGAGGADEIGEGVDPEEDLAQQVHGEGVDGAVARRV
jgi:hypothetical protein